MRSFAWRMDRLDDVPECASSRSTVVVVGERFITGPSAWPAASRTCVDAWLAGDAVHTLAIAESCERAWGAKSAW